MKPDEIRTIGICGIGQMGSACAVGFKRAGYRVLLWGRDQEKLAAVRGSLDEMDRWCDENSDAEVVLGGQIVSESDFQELDHRADVLLDCIVEVMAEKVELLRRFKDAPRRDTLFLSATSGLSITEMGRRSELQDKLVGAHFWNPPHLIPVVEMVRGEATPESMVRLGCDLMRRIGKIPVVCKDVPGFVGNRLMHAMWREAIHLVETGVCTAQDVDRIVKLTFALRLPLLGPMENMDYVGIDLVERVQRYLAPSLAGNTEPGQALTDKLAAGDLGVKTGKGFYDWSQRDAAEVVRRRDAQVVQQLRFLKQLGEI